MADFQFICSEVQRVLRKYDETDPFRLCRAMGISVYFSPMGTHPESCKGFFLCQSRIKSITINSDLSEEFQRIICAHELGHAILHKDQSGVKAFHDFALFDAASRFEYEANIFAAEYLLKDTDVLELLNDDLSFFQAAAQLYVLELLNDDLSFFQAAAQLYVPAEILDFKFRTLKWKGYKVIDAPLRANSNWLKNAPDGGQ